MKKIFKNIPENYKLVVLFLTIIAVVLIGASFFVPPLGVIDGSVLAATGELFAFSGLWVGIIALEKGYDATFRKGDCEVTLTDDEKNDDREK